MWGPLLDQFLRDGDRQAPTLGTELAEDKSLPHQHWIGTALIQYRVVEVIEEEVIVVVAVMVVEVIEEVVIVVVVEIIEEVIVVLAGGEAEVVGITGTQDIIVLMVTLEMAGEEKTPVIFQMGDLPYGNQGEEVREHTLIFPLQLSDCSSSVILYNIKHLLFFCTFPYINIYSV